MCTLQWQLYLQQNNTTQQKGQDKRQHYWQYSLKVTKCVNVCVKLLSQMVQNATSLSLPVTLDLELVYLLPLGSSESV